MVAKQWKTTEKHKKMLDTFQNRCLTQLLKVRWPDKISNEKLHCIQEQQKLAKQ
jgi:hypothetical protein